MIAALSLPLCELTTRARVLDGVGVGGVSLGRQDFTQVADFTFNDAARLSTQHVSALVSVT